MKNKPKISLPVVHFPRPSADRIVVEAQAATSASEYVQALKNGNGGAWSAAEIVERAKISRQALRERRDTFAVVYWTDAKGCCHYPKWQFDADLQVLPPVRAILALLRTHDTVRVLTTFLVPSIGEPGTSPLQLIRAGRGKEAVVAIRSREKGR